MQPLFILIHIGDGTKQADGIRVRRMVENLLPAAVLYDISSIDYSDLIAVSGHHTHIMCNQYHGCMNLLL